VPVFRSRFEATVSRTIPDAAYEPIRIPFVQPAKSRTYTPDFRMRNGILIETKGILSLDDRNKAIWVRDQNPHLDIRFVFMNSSLPISKGSKTTYAMWAELNGFLWCQKIIPEDWIISPVKTVTPTPAQV
jgi:hypothetical protein